MSTSEWDDETDYIIDDDGHKKRRVNVTTACASCQKFHTSCDEVRPCKKCLDKGKPCLDGIARKRGRKKGSRLNKTRKFQESPTYTPPSVPVLVQTPEMPPAESPTRSDPSIWTPAWNNQDMSTWENGDSLFVSEESPSSPDSGLSPLEDFQEGPSEFEIDNLILSLQSDPMPEFTSYRGISDPNETPSTFSRNDSFEKVSLILRRRVPEKSVEFERIVRSIKPHLRKVREHLSKEAYESIWGDFDQTLTQMSYLFEQLGIPSLIWERCGIIHYCNKAYKGLTGFDSQIPTFWSDFELLNQLSDDGLANFLEGMQSVFNTCNSWQFPTGIRLAGRNEFVRGTMCVTLKRDILGLPLIFYGNFLPTL